MRKILYIILVFSINASSQTTDWVVSFGGPDSDKGISIGVDSLGFIYGSGYYNNTATFGNITLTNSPLSTSGNNKENFVFKMDSLGNVLWAVPAGNQEYGCCDDLTNTCPKCVDTEFTCLIPEECKERYGEADFCNNLPKKL